MENVESRTCRAEIAERQFPVGAELLPDGGVSFRVWAPKRRSVQVVVGRVEPDGDSELACDLEAEKGDAAERGYFSGVVPEARVGMLYGFRLDGDARVLPDPASRFQPQGPTGLSQIIDPRSFRWSDRAW
jgi:maltooligosyltrehalose trehalohydrolase